MLIICLVYIVMTIPVAVYVVAIVMGKEHDMPPSFKFVAVWIMFLQFFRQ